MNENKIILDLAGGSGVWSKPYKEAGYTVYNITLPDYDIMLMKVLPLLKCLFVPGKKTYLLIDFKYIYGILFAPVCTHFSLARTRAKTPRDFREAMRLVKKGLDIIWECRYNHKLKFWCLENPQGYLRQFLGKPAMTFNPCDFGDPYTKKTDLWGYFNFPKKTPIKLTDEQKKLCYSNSRKLPLQGNPAISRAITPSGFANAFFKANKIV